MQSSIKKQIKERMNLFIKVALGWLFITAFVFILTQDANYFKGDIFGGGSTKTDAFYIPDYNAKAGDIGDIQIISTNALNNVAGVSFELVFNPEQITLADNTATNNQFDFVNSQVTAPGRLKVVAALGNLNGVDFSAGAEILTINELNIKTGLADNLELNLQVENFEIVTSVAGVLTTQTENVTNGKIVINSGNSLKLIAAESIDTNTVKLEFSDYITQLWTFSFNGGLFATNSSIDPENGKNIIVLTNNQAQGVLYSVTANGTLGNLEGGLDSNYQTAYFSGKGTITAVSDFNLVSAEAFSATGISLIFSDEILDGSVYPSGFSVSETLTGTTLTVIESVKSISNSKEVILTLANTSPLNQNWNYLVEIDKVGLATNLRRKSDQALVGKNIETFPGFISIALINQLELISAEAEASNQVVVSFSENLNANSVNVANFIVAGFTVTNVVIPHDGLYNKVLLTLNSDLDPTQYYVVSTINTTAYSGNLLGAKNSATFVGYGLNSNTSTLAMITAESQSETELLVSFNEAFLASSILPVNFEILPTLTISDVQIQGKSVVLTTSKQEAETLYTVVAKADKVKDLNGRVISNQNTQTFFGYKAVTPVIQTITPKNIVNNIDQTVIITGQNFPTGTSVYLNNQKLQVVQNQSQLSVTIPAQTLAGVYAFTLKFPNGNEIRQENALVIENEKQWITVLSDESYASPRRIPNDGTLFTSLWVRIEDPEGVNNIDRVNLDLRDLNQAAAVAMQPQSVVDNKRWYKLAITVPPTVQTSETPISIPVIAENKSGDKAFGTVELIVSRDITSSIPPVVEQAYSTPNVLVPGGTEDVYFYAYVRDEDGAETLNNVILNLGPIGGGPMLMEPVGGVSQTQIIETNVGTGITSLLEKVLVPNVFADFSAPTSQWQWYKTTSAFHVPQNIKNANYSLEVIATDQTGETGSFSFSVSVSVGQNGPTIDLDRAYITPRDSIPNDGKTTFGIQAYVSDPDGIADITSVMLSMEELRLAPVRLTTETTVGKGAWFSVENLTIPKEVIKGIKEVTVIATDKAGGESEITLEMKVTNFDEVGEAPEVESAKSYTVPSMANNDTTSKIALYAFVADQDDDLDYVTVNLSNIAEYQGESYNKTGTGTYEWETDTTTDFYNFNNTPPDPCSINSQTVHCMFPSVKEGDTGQWYVLPDIVVPTSTLPSMEPYRIWVTAVDKTGKTSKGYINLNVTNGYLPTQEGGLPTLEFASATSPTTVELVFSHALNKENVYRTGRDFTITEKFNVSNVLNISKAELNAEGTTVILTTNKQKAKKEYAVTANPERVGLKDNRLSDTMANFEGYQINENRPVIQKVASISSYLVEVTFNVPLKPSSMAFDGSNFRIVEKNNEKNPLTVYNAKFKDERTILVSTNLQSSSREYKISATNLISASGRPISVAGTVEYFRGFRTLEHYAGDLKSRADFNSDGRVDFTDFTMFSSVYGEFLEALDATDSDESVEDLNTGLNDANSFPKLDVTAPAPYPEEE